MYVCIYVCVYVYVYMHIYIYIYISATQRIAGKHIYTFAHTYNMSVCTCIVRVMYIHNIVVACKHSYIHTRLYIHTPVYTQIWLFSYSGRVVPNEGGIWWRQPLEEGAEFAFHWSNWFTEVWLCAENKREDIDVEKDEEIGVCVCVCVCVFMYLCMYAYVCVC